ncbi:MAG: zf-HC2 domain-containing protein [Candidatus Aureabacteria bacterium]|nr:zf-HC2 domain-containing protein [Candidatus Auribacterota bacterium]
MNCQEIREHLYPYIDGELKGSTVEQIKEHIANCPLCSMEIRNEKDFDKIFRSCFPMELASYDFKEKLLEKVRNESEKSNIFSFKFAKPIAAAILIVLAVVYMYGSLKDPAVLLSDATKTHISMMQEKVAFDISSSDAKEVSSKLQQKLDFNVSFPDLSKEGANLKGACVCSINKKNAAHAIYVYQGHKISVFMFSSKEKKIRSAKKVTLNNRDYYIKNEKGYNSIFWSNNGIGCVITSNLNETDLLYLIKQIS